MQLQIVLKIEEPLSLPLAYHHILQGAIYNLSVDPEQDEEDSLHENGFKNGKRQYRLFCFSILEGPHTVKDGRIIFQHHVCFEVRSVDSDWIATIEKNAMLNGVRFGGNVYEVAFMKRSFAGIFKEGITFRTASPITIHSTDPETNHTKYYSPEDSEFSIMINRNFRNKYLACTGQEPEGGIHIECLQPERLKQYKTWYKDFCIIGWMGKFHITGDPEALTFLYETGLGDRNSQGFGLMRVPE